MKDAIFIKIDLVQQNGTGILQRHIKDVTKEFDTKMHRKLDCLQLKVDHVDDVFLCEERIPSLQFIMKAKTL